MRKLARPERAASNKWFFKTGTGEYGEGDRFLGVTVPQLRSLAHEYRNMPLKYVVTLLRSPWHEERLLALLILVGQYVRGDARTRQVLREIGKRNGRAEERFLRKHASTMPRTMLRYAIERFPPSLRRTYLSMSHRKDAETQRLRS